MPMARPEQDGVKTCKSFHGQLLHLKDLYGEDIPMDRSKFDYVFHFETGRLCLQWSRTVRSRKARRINTGSSPRRQSQESRVSFSQPRLSLHAQKGKYWSDRNGKVFLSSESLGVRRALRSRYRWITQWHISSITTDSMKTRPDDVYWLPNHGDPPPNCPCASMS